MIECITYTRLTNSYTDSGLNFSEQINNIISYIRRGVTNLRSVLNTFTVHGIRHNFKT